MPTLEEELADAQLPHKTVTLGLPEPIATPTDVQAPTKFASGQ